MGFFPNGYVVSANHVMKSPGTYDAPQYLQDLLEVNQPSRSLRSSSAPRLKVPDPGTKTYKDRAFSTAAPILWNGLSADIRNLPTLQSFKTAIKKLTCLGNSQNQYPRSYKS